ncbi:uncharacterized protein AMSG_11957 [Thecamonas trahens ATCC 50062]|uniref:Uncharacterized protein n=1 Tax=Thecamonas trahens ATCC 50062 TaxID=461836 RepID=A0A0L0DF63_THETB|nr:hypothetical protein AMSG_11957 [Thecamonas trahens ATCC 50062]KNC49958.1 hypothetical protein AMSG_11957 [Thecamonas trahens ATCC 50062]|eukprot:XP_013757457.1 hypothetical protein AMSG_11957 [Thecamonas trahens ATCC 50062]
MAAEVQDEDAQTELYLQKCAQLEALYHEVHQLENAVPARRRKRLAALDSAVADPSEAMVRLQGQLRETLEQVDQLHDKNETLSQLLVTKSSALEQANTELLRAHERNEELSKDVRMLEEMNTKMKEARGSAGSAAGSAAAAFKDVPDQSYFQLLDRLENEIKAKDAEIKELWKDRKTMDLQLKRKDAFIDKLQDDLRAQAQSYEDVAQLDGKVRELSHKIDELNEENKLLNNLCRVKTTAIEKLQLELEARAQSEEYVRQLETGIRNKERAIHTLQEDLERMDNMLRKRDDELDAVAEEMASSQGGVKFREWYEERRGLKAELERVMETVAGKEKIIQSQHQRINQLSGRLDTLSRSLSDTAHISPRHAGMMATPRRPGGGVFVDEDGQELIAAELYDALARDVHIMKVKLAEKDNLLDEKDDVIECWERKNDILSKTFAQEAKSFKRQRAELQAELDGLRDLGDERECAIKEREQQLKMDNIRLKKEISRLRKTNLSLSRGDISPQEDRLSVGADHVTRHTHAPPTLSLALLLLATLSLPLASPSPTTLAILPPSTFSFFSGLHTLTLAHPRLDTPCLTLVYRDSATQLAFAPQCDGYALIQTVDIALLLADAYRERSLAYDPYISLAAADNFLVIADHVRLRLAVFTIARRRSQLHPRSPIIITPGPVISLPLSHVGGNRREVGRSMALADGLLVAVIHSGSTSDIGSAVAWSVCEAATEAMPLWTLSPPADDIADLVSYGDAVALDRRATLVAVSMRSRLRTSSFAGAAVLRHRPGVAIYSLDDDRTLPPHHIHTVFAEAAGDAITRVGIDDNGRIVLSVGIRCSRLALLRPQPLYPETMTLPRDEYAWAAVAIAPDELLAVECFTEALASAQARALVLARDSREPDTWQARRGVLPARIWFAAHAAHDTDWVDAEMRATALGVGATSAAAVVAGGRRLALANWMLTFATNAAFVPAVAAALARGWKTEALIGVAVVVASSGYHWSDVTLAPSVAGIPAGSWHRLDNLAAVLMVQALFLRTGAWAIRGPPPLLRLGLGLVALAIQVYAPWEPRALVLPIAGALLAALAPNGGAAAPRDIAWRSPTRAVTALLTVLALFWFVLGLTRDDPDALCQIVAQAAARGNNQQARAPATPLSPSGQLVAAVGIGTLRVVMMAAVAVGTVGTTAVACLGSGAGCVARLPLVSDAAVMPYGAGWYPVGAAISGLVTATTGEILAAALNNGAIRATGWLSGLAMIGSGLVSEVTGEAAHVALTGLTICGLSASTLLLARQALAPPAGLTLQRWLPTAGLTGVASLTTLMWALHTRRLRLELFATQQVVYAAVEAATIGFLVWYQGAWGSALAECGYEVAVVAR